MDFGEGGEGGEAVREGSMAFSPGLPKTKPGVMSQGEGKRKGARDGETHTMVINYG